MADKFNAKRQKQKREGEWCNVSTCLKFVTIFIVLTWMLVIGSHVKSIRAMMPDVISDIMPAPVVGSGSAKDGNKNTGTLPVTPIVNPNLRAPATATVVPFEEQDESYHIVFSTGCSEFQDWQSIGVYSSAETVGQRGIITRIASGCTAEQEVSLTHAMSHLPDRFKIHFAPNTDVKDHKGHFYKYANKPLGMMHWLMHANPPVCIYICDCICGCIYSCCVYSMYIYMLYV